MASSQGGNEVTGAFQTGGSVEQTKLNTPGIFWRIGLVFTSPTDPATCLLHARKVFCFVFCLVAHQAKVHDRRRVHEWVLCAFVCAWNGSACYA